MSITTFIGHFAAQFDDTPIGDIQADSAFRDLDEWSSLIGMSIIAMTKEEYNVKLSGEEIRNCVTVDDVYQLVISKKA